MAKKIKFALEMADSEQVRNLDALREHFDIEKVIGYYLNGRLLTWLKDRYYDEEAQKVSELSKDDPQLHNKLCAIFGVESEVKQLNAEEIARRTERFNKLKQYTYDRDVLDRVDQVAFDQEELSDLLDEDMTLIYLCNNRFIIPLRETNKMYVGVGKAVAVIRSNKIINFDDLGITFRNIKFDDDYDSMLKKKTIAEQNQREKEKAELPEKLFKEGEAAYDAKDYKTALEKYKQAANLDHSGALYSMAIMYQSGFGITKDINEANRLIKLGMDKGNANSFGFYGLMILRNSNNVTESEKREAFSLIKKATEMGCSDNYYWYALGNMYRRGEGTSQNLKEAFNCYLKGADAGDGDAMNMVGVMYSNGEYVEENPFKAVELFQKAADLGNISAMKNLAYCYEENKGVNINADKVFELYQQATDAGDPESMWRIGNCYCNGFGINQNYEKAVAWYRKAVDAGYVEAINSMGNMYYSGKGVKQDYNAAFHCYKNAAEAGDSRGMYKLANMYRDGEGTVRDITEAIRLYNAAIELGNTSALNELGYMYRDGNGVPKDLRRAAAYFKQSADAGNTEGMRAIGWMFVNEGGNSNYQRAFDWFKKADCAGNAEAADDIDYLYKNGLLTKKDITIYSPIKGTLISLADCNDPVFAGGAMGRGIAIKNPQGKVYAPFDGEITVFFDTHHAIGLHSDDGIDLLIHVGMDTVSLRGNYFTPKAEQGDKVKKGQLLLEFDTNGLKSAHFDTTTPIVVTNHKYFGDITFKCDDQKRTVLDPNSNINYSSSNVNNEKKKDGCFITTAVCDTFGKADDCYELTTFRSFRDNWLINQSDGKSLIEEYYKVAPKIVDTINHLADSIEVYQHIWKNYLNPCLKFIESGNNDKCKKLYIDMVNTLKNKYLRGKNCG